MWYEMLIDLLQILQRTMKTSLRKWRRFTASCEKSMYRCFEWWVTFF